MPDIYIIKKDLTKIIDLKEIIESEKKKILEHISKEFNKDLSMLKDKYLIDE